MFTIFEENRKTDVSTSNNEKGITAKKMFDRKPLKEIAKKGNITACNSNITTISSKCKTTEQNDSSVTVLKDSITKNTTLVENSTHQIDVLVDFDICSYKEEKDDYRDIFETLKQIKISSTKPRDVETPPPKKSEFIPKLFDFNLENESLPDFSSSFEDFEIDSDEDVPLPDLSFMS